MTDCRACGCPIEFIMGPNGKKIPVQKVKTLYLRQGDADQLQKAEMDFGVATHALYVSHFETCSNPERFSRRKG